MPRFEKHIFICENKREPGHPRGCCSEKGSPETGCEEGESQYHGSFYYSEKANQLIAKQRQERDPKARDAQFVQLQTLIAEDVPFIPLWQSKDYAFAQKDIAGVQLNATQQILPFWTIRHE